MSAPTEPWVERWVEHWANRRGVEALCWLAGSIDTTTGLLLVSVPGVTLTLMGIRELPAETVFLRWVGIFVAGVGMAYLLPLLLPRLSSRARRYGHRERALRLRTMLEITTLLRFVVAIFVTMALLRGALAWSWISVPATDFSIAFLQIGLLARSWPEREPRAEGISNSSDAGLRSAAPAESTGGSR